MVLFLGLAPNLNLKVDNLSDSYHIVSHVSLAGEVIRLNCASVDIDHEVISLILIQRTPILTQSYLVRWKLHRSERSHLQQH
jgi:hypothetical protein